MSYGEANYTLPLFSSSYMNTLSNNVLWSRHVLNDDYICTFYNSTDSNFNVMYSNINDSTTLMYNNKKIIAYPMMYLR